MGNNCPVADSLSANPGLFFPGQSGELTATAHDPDGSLTSYDFSSTDGTFSNGTSTISVPTSAGSVTVPWTAPAATGDYTVTVKVWDNGGIIGNPTSGATSTLSINVTVSVTNHAPLITSLTSDRSALFLSQSASLSSVVSDADGDPITLAWSTNFGTVTEAGPASATFQAPPTPGFATVTLTATDSLGASSSASISLSVTDAVAERAIGASLGTPQRLAADSWGNLFVVDRAAGGLAVVNAASGARMATIASPGATSIAVAADNSLLLGNAAGAQILDHDGRFLRALSPGEPIGAATDVAIDRANSRSVVLYGGAGRVVTFGPTGSVAAAFGSIGDNPGQFMGASALAVDAAGQIYVGDLGHGTIQVFTAAGDFLRSMGGRGSTPGKFNQLQGLAVDATGVVWATDAFQSQVQAFNADGSLREIVGSYGSGVGELQTPTGIASLDAWGKLVVASLNGGQLQVFSLQGAVQPPANTPPTTPAPVSPADGASLPNASPVELEAANAFDPDFQILRNEFQLFADGTPAVLVRSWMTTQTAPTTWIDASAEAANPGIYFWRVRAFDGAAYSEWSADQHFSVSSGPANSAPGAPGLLSPAIDTEVSSLTPPLVVSNAIDTDGDPLAYTFEVALAVEGTLISVAQSPDVPAGPGTTVWYVPATVLELSQPVFWRARADDGYQSGPWSAWQRFRTPPLTVPDDDAYGDIPTGDRTRADEVTFTMPASTSDVVIAFQLFDITTPAELVLDVNSGRAIHPIAAQIGEDWSLTLTVTLFSTELNATAPNRFRFVHSGTGDAWGVRQVHIGAPLPPVLSARAWNTVIDLSWESPSDLPTGTKLRVLRAFWPTGPFSIVDDLEPRRALLRDTGLFNDYEYFYRAAWVDESGQEGEPSAVVSATPSATWGPTPIVDLRLTKKGLDIEMTWTPVTSYPSIERYETYRDIFDPWLPDTGGQTNLLMFSSPFDSTLSVLSGADTGPDRWYSIVPYDYLGGRATP